MNCVWKDTAGSISDGQPGLLWNVVELGRSSQDYVEILSGLEEGETVLVPIQSADSSAGSTAVMASGG